MESVSESLSTGVCVCHRYVCLSMWVCESVCVCECVGMTVGVHVWLSMCLCL